MLSLRSARESALFSMREAQGRYKTQYDKKCKQVNFKLGDWIMIRFPHEESGKQRKLSRPWHGPYKEMTQMLLLLRCTSWMRLRYRCIRIGHVMLLLSCHQDSTGMGAAARAPGRSQNGLKDCWLTIRKSRKLRRRNSIVLIKKDVMAWTRKKVTLAKL